MRSPPWFELGRILRRRAFAGKLASTDRGALAGRNVGRAGVAAAFAKRENTRVRYMIVAPVVRMRFRMIR
jgi:hypothetical protein